MQICEIEASTNGKYIATYYTFSYLICCISCIYVSHGSIESTESTSATTNNALIIIICSVIFGFFFLLAILLATILCLRSRR